MARSGRSELECFETILETDSYTLLGYCEVHASTARNNNNPPQTYVALIVPTKDAPQHDGRRVLVSAHFRVFLVCTCTCRGMSTMFSSDYITEQDQSHEALGSVHTHTHTHTYLTSFAASTEERTEVDALEGGGGLG